MEILDVRLPDNLSQYMTVKTWVDNTYPRYTLVGERFRDEKELLALMVKYEGACKISALQPQAMTNTNCDFNCATCKNSIYNELEVRRKFFNNQCMELCDRTPCVGDEWETNFVMANHHSPKYITLFWSCTAKCDDTPIISIIYDTVMEFDSTLFKHVELQYTKIRRFDDQRPIDVSFYANQRLKELHLKRA